MKTIKKKINNLSKEGAYKKDILAPLKVLDKSLSLSIFLSLNSLVFLVLISFAERPDILDRTGIVELLVSAYLQYNAFSLQFADKVLLPLGYKISSDLVCSLISVTFIKLFYNLRSLNINIETIIKVWEDDLANKAKEDRRDE
ncbi:MAG: hypothetical protein Q3M30_00275 [Candidatus Electrothrix sp. Rat3]|nr:hypothetical protein [Candidatus Electrothrix rattekaaiensis]